MPITVRSPPREFAKVLFNHLPIVSRQILADLLQRLLAFRGWQVAPAGLAADLFGIDVARPFASHRQAVLSGIRGLQVPDARGRLLLLLLLFDLLDQLVELGDHFVFLLPHTRAGSFQFQPAADFVHQPGDLVQRIRFQRRDVGLDELGDGQVAPRDAADRFSSSRATSGTHFRLSGMRW